MAKQRLFPEKARSDTREPHERFADLARKVVAVPKSDIDERERQWRRAKTRRPVKR